MSTTFKLDPNAHPTKPKRRFRFMWKLWLVSYMLFLIPFTLLFLIDQQVFGALPSTKQLEDPDLPLATEIYSIDGVQIGKFYDANRSQVGYEDLGENIPNALIATEDIRFKRHSGIDLRRTLTIVPYNLIGKRQGASTITQQLAKNLFPRKSSISKPQLVLRKLKEWVMAIRLERLYTKDEIMSMYLNTVEFGNNSLGIKSASKVYFGKEPNELAVQEAALLIGVLKGIGAYDPIRKEAKALTRRNVVLKQMVKQDYLTEVAYDKLKLKPLGLNFKSESHTQGIATYFREHVRQELKSWCAERGIDLYKDGLKVYTTIDSRVQKLAEEAVSEHIKTLQKDFLKQFKGKNKPWSSVPTILELTKKRSHRYHAMKDLGATDEQISAAFEKKVKMKVFGLNLTSEVDTFMSPMDSIRHYKYFLQAGMMAMQPDNGQIKAWVGGINNKYFQYDHCSPEASRQVGSTFKPFVYARALQMNISPCAKYPNVDVVFEDYDNWSPKNSDKLFEGKMITMRQGMASSINKVTARVLQGLDDMEGVVHLAEQCGITKGKVQPYPSMCLGVTDLSLYEMLGAYNTFNNNGQYVEPQIFVRIENKDGEIIETFSPATRTVLDEPTNYVLVNMMQSVTQPKMWGTASALRYKFKIEGPVGGKTGTTQKQADTWFMGIIPQLTAGVWVGCEDPSIHLTGSSGLSNKAALPIYGIFLKKLYADKTLPFDPKRDWVKPNSEKLLEMDCNAVDAAGEDPGDNPLLDVGLGPDVTE